MPRFRAALAASVATFLGFGVAAAQTQTAPRSPTSIDGALAADPDRAPPAAAAAHPTPAASGGVNTAVTVGPDGTRHELISNPPVRDTSENRAKYGAPMSNAGKQTQPAGN